MKTQNKILFGVIALGLAMLPVILAGEIDIGGGPVQEEPQVYLIKKVFDICDQYGGHKSGSDPLPGGSVPPSGSQYGCVDYIGDRFNEYLFTGEQMAMLVAVRHTQGAISIMRADLALDGALVAKCNEIDPEDLLVEVGGTCKNKGTEGSCVGLDKTACTVTYSTLCDWTPTYAYMWFGHDVASDLADQPPAKTAGTPTGFDPLFDKLYECILTATEDMVDEMSITVIAEDQMGETGESVPDQVWFNPEIFIDVFVSSGTAIEFSEGSAGQTVYSTNTLKIKNELTDNAGVDVAVWLAGTDLTSSVLPAKCPDSNVLEAEKIEFRCKVGTVFNNPWHKVPNPNDKLSCNPVRKQNEKPCVLKWNDATDNYYEECTCQGALDIVPDAGVENILYAGHTAECWFRLEYPVPCVGLFDMGEILVFARAI